MTEHTPGHVWRELDAAKAEHRKGHYSEARRRYHSILQHWPDLTQALHFLGVLEHMDGNSELGLALVHKAHSQAPDDYDIRKNLGNLLNDCNRASEAEPLCRALVAERPGDATNHSNHAAALRQIGRHHEAISAARQAIALAPQNAIGWLALAHALYGNGELSDAAQAYERVIELKPAFSAAHDSLCRVLLQIEQAGFISRLHMRRSRRAYRRWVAAVPDHPTARFMLDALEHGKVPERAPDATVKASFDAYAEHFDKHIRSLGYRAPELVADVLARRLDNAGERQHDVLDGGCGTGLMAPLLRPLARHLTGVDLSPAMLTRSRATGCYDVLEEAELGTFLRARPSAFDVCVFADVLPYFGALHAILASAAHALKPNGLLAFSVEESNRRGSQLHPTGRYSHHASHVEAALAAAGLIDTELFRAAIRNEGHLPVNGLIVSAHRRA